MPISSGDGSLQDAVLAALGSVPDPVPRLVSGVGLRTDTLQTPQLVELMTFCLGWRELPFEQSTAEQCIRVIASKPAPFPSFAMAASALMSSASAAQTQLLSSLLPNALLTAARQFPVATPGNVAQRTKQLLEVSYQLLSKFDTSGVDAVGSSYREKLTSIITTEAGGNRCYDGKDGPLVTLVKPLHDALAPDERMAPWFRKLLACAIAEASKYVAPEPAPLPPEPPPLAPLAPLPPVVGWGINVSFTCRCSMCQPAIAFLNSATEQTKAISGPNATHRGHLTQMMQAASKLPKRLLAAAS